MDGIGLETFLFLFILGLMLPAWRLLNLRRAKRRQVIGRFLEDVQAGLSLSRDDYLFPEGSHRRSNFIERRFRRRYHFELLEIFDHSCANCKRSLTKLEIDHFFIPKSLGGNLMMQHKRGYWVSNGILLCRRCNANKADQSVNDFFNEDVLEDILKKNTKTSFAINGLEDKETR